MAQKAAAPKKVVKKPAVVVKAKAKAKPAAKKSVAKGQTLNCEVCGMAVVIEQVGDVAVAQESVLLCCDEPMKPKAAKAAKTAAPKAKVTSKK
jgi:hypothetical protein